MKRTLAEDALLVEAGSLDAMKQATKRPQTQNAGASLERQAWVRFGRRRKPVPAQGEDFGIGYLTCKREFLQFGKDRTKRNNAKSGGLGKKK